MTESLALELRVRSRSKRSKRSPVAVAIVAFVAALVLTLNAPMAWGHAELIEADPARSSTVGGNITTISLQFVGLAHPGDNEVVVVDPLDDLVEVLSFDIDFNRIDLTVAPLTTEGTYLVRYRTLGADGDTGIGEYEFVYDADAPPPDGLSIMQQKSSGLRLDAVTISLMALTALSVVVWIAYVVRRLRQPVEAAADDEEAGSVGDLDELDDGDDGFVRSD